MKALRRLANYQALISRVQLEHPKKQSDVGADCLNLAALFAGSSKGLVHSVTGTTVVALAPILGLLVLRPNSYPGSARVHLRLCLLAWLECELQPNFPP